jgi:hypothetical protein
MKDDFSTNEGVDKALDEALGIWKLSDIERYNIRALVLRAYYAGRDSGIMHMSDAWKKNIDKTFAHLERNLV